MAALFTAREPELSSETFDLNVGIKVAVDTFAVGATARVSRTSCATAPCLLCYAGAGGWTLSPAYDLNPVPSQIKPRFLSTAIGEDPVDTTASLAAAFEVAEYFDMDQDEARFASYEIAQVTSHWADRAQSMGLPGTEVDLMATAFEHDDLKLALASG